MFKTTLKRKKVRLGKNLIVELPENFKARPLPFYKRWLKALRSGKFSQTTGTLAKVDEDTNEVKGYCCLGVLSSIQGRLDENGYDGGDTDGVLAKSNPCYLALTRPNIQHNPFDGTFESHREEEAAGEFPEGVKVVYKGESKKNLAELNDAKATFATVAKVIELLWKPRS
jgi:hypothetical protein